MLHTLREEDRHDIIIKKHNFNGITPNRHPNIELFLPNISFLQFKSSNQQTPSYNEKNVDTVKVGRTTKMNTFIDPCPL